MTEPQPSQKRKPIGLFGALLLVAAMLAGGLYLDSLPGKPYVPEASQHAGMTQPSPAQTSPTQAEPTASVPSISSERMESVESRIAALELTQAGIQQTLAEQMATPHSSSEQSPPEGEQVDGTLMLQEIERLHAEIEALKAATPTVTEIAPPPVKDSLLVKLYKLEKQARSGSAFDDALDALLEDPSLTDSAHQKLHGLVKPAKRGIASARQLETLFHESMDTYMSGGALSEPEDATTWEKVQHNLGSLVTVRKLGSVEDEGDAAHLARAQAAFVEEDVTTAVEEVSQLEEGVQKYFEPWLAKARRHLRVLQAIERARDLLDEAPTEAPVTLSPGNV